MDVLEDVGYETSAYQTTPEPFSAQNEAERAAKAGFDLIIAAGGDGTINEVVNGVAGLENRPQMAFIPTGTTNDYARALKIPMGDPVAAARIIEKNQTIQMDIGRAYGSKYFINIAAAGTMTELTFSVPSSVKSRFGLLLPMWQKLLKCCRETRLVRCGLSMTTVSLKASVYDFRGLDQL